MIIVRIVRGVTDHFHARSSEWQLSFSAVIWGVVVALPGEVFTSVAWEPLARWGSETSWGSAAVVIGGLRLVALIINGTFADTWYGRYSPHVRATMAFLTCFLWATLSLGLISSGALSTAFAAYPVFFCFDAWNARRAAVDAAFADRIKADAAPGV